MALEQAQALRLLDILRDVARAVIQERRPADLTFSALCREHREWGARDRRFYGDALFAWFRWRGWLADQPPEAALAVAGWLDGLGQLALRQLATQAGLKLPEVVPATLEEKARAVATLLGAAKEITQLVPDWVLPLLAAPEHHAQHLAALQRRPPVWLRVAPEQVPAVLKFFNVSPARAAAHPRVAGAIALRPPANLPGLRVATGIAAIVQDLASQCVGLVCAPRPGERWWDVCAGAGGKTLHLAALMGNRGAVLATDVRYGALFELGRRATEAGATIIQTKLIEAPAAVDEPFDGVLVDAPCSGLGTWNRNPDMRWRTAAAEVEAKAALQRPLLARAARNVRPGGVLVYAVCTVTEAETRGVADDFTHAHPGFQPEAAAHPLTGATTDGYCWVWPWEGPCDGMFIARWRRKA